MKPTTARLSAHSDDGTPPYTYTLRDLSSGAKRAIAQATDSAENGIKALVVEAGSLEATILRQALHFTRETGLDDLESVQSFAQGAGVPSTARGAIGSAAYLRAFDALAALLGAT